MRKVRFSEVEDTVTAGTMIGVDYAQGAKVGRPVRVGVELKVRVIDPDTGKWVWCGRIVRCSKVLEHLYLGALIRIPPELNVMVLR